MNPEEQKGRCKHVCAHEGNGKNVNDQKYTESDWWKGEREKGIKMIKKKDTDAYLSYCWLYE